MTTFMLYKLHMIGSVTNIKMIATGLELLSFPLFFLLLVQFTSAQESHYILLQTLVLNG
jgi:hypothetical protein